MNEVSDRTRHAHDERHEKQDGPGLAEQSVGGVFRHQPDDPADEGRDHRVEDRQYPADDEKRHRDPAHLADEMPVKTQQSGYRRRHRLRSGRIDQSFYLSEHGPWVNRPRRFVNPRRASPGLPTATGAAQPSPWRARGPRKAAATRLSPASSRRKADPA